MAKGPWTNDEIRAADDRLQQRCETTFPIITINELIAELTAPTLRPDQPVMYDCSTEDAAIMCFYEELNQDHPTVSNVRALFTELEVMGIVILVWNRGWWNSEEHNQRWWQAQLDTIKYGGKR